MRRFHLLSFLLAMIVAGVLLGLNLRGEYEHIPPSFYNSEIGHYSYGFPANSVHFSATIYYDGIDASMNPLIALNNLKTEDMQRVKRGWMHVEENPFFIEKAALAIDLCVLMAGGMAALFACEFFLRRRDARIRLEARV